MIAGQSNAVGQGTTLNTYPWTGHVAGLYKKSGPKWRNLADPTDTAPSGGSVWPGVATSYISAHSTNVGFIQAAVNGSGIESWLPGTANYNNMKAQVLAANVSGKIKAIMWWQGEYDAGNHMTQALYHSYLATMAAQISTDFGVPFMVVKLQKMLGVADVDTARIQAAQAQAWGDVTNVVAGPDLSDLTTDDFNHFTTDAQIAVVSGRWWNAINAAFP